MRYLDELLRNLAAELHLWASRRLRGRAGATPAASGSAMASPVFRGITGVIDERSEQRADTGGLLP